MSDKDNGGPAFPSSDEYGDWAGMTLRDWFAGQALANPRTFPTDATTAYDIAYWAYGIADAMLEARK